MKKPRTIKIGQTIQLTSGPRIVTGYGKGVFRLRDDATGDIELMHYRELSRQLLPGESVETEEAPSPTLAETMEHLSNEARFLAPHMQELIDGTPAVGTEPRPEYDDSLPMSRRLASKVSELKALGIEKMSEPTLKRRLARYRQLGMAGLTDLRTVRPTNPLSRVDKIIRETIGELLDDYVGHSTITYTKVRADLRRVLRERFPNAEERPALPSLSTVMRIVKSDSGDQNPTRAAARRQTDDLVPKRSFKPRGAAAPGDECQVDTTMFDALVRMPDGRIERPHLTVLIDKKTRSIISHAFTVGAPSGYDHALLLANALVPRRLRSWSNNYDLHGLEEMPWAAHLDDHQRAAFDTHRPYIFPRRILIDNGQDYKSLVFRAACERYGISITEAPPQSPTTKGHVERIFGTISTKFAQFLPGYVGGSVATRGQNAVRANVMNLRDVDELFDRWVAIVWQNREHAGLKDYDDPAFLHTPNTMYMASLELTGHFTVALEEDDFIALMPSERRAVQTDGISFHSRTYDSPHLLPYRRLRNIDGSPAHVVVHYDPTDKNQVWVRGKDNRWITCAWTALPGMRRPLDSELMRRAADFSQKTTKFDDETSDELVTELRDAVASEATDREAEVKRQQRSDRLAVRRAAKRAERAAEIDDDDDDDFILEAG
ncbi:Mu transposase C-terminal domain-containing protein [Microbacterium sp. NPDC090225]|uniref:Mu transposase C-terminal domain-containing protein n=1 Tax=Microbacterium sp. NPDC090225 TaxID=3364207 RepID=UPI00380F921C